MSDNRKYYYLKLKENFFTDEKMVILESMQDGLLYSNLLLKMYLMSLKHNGVLMLNDRLPHTPQTTPILAMPPTKERGVQGKKSPKMIPGRYSFHTLSVTPTDTAERREKCRA